MLNGNRDYLLCMAMEQSDLDITRGDLHISDWEELKITNMSYRYSKQVETCIERSLKDEEILAEK